MIVCENLVLKLGAFCLDALSLSVPKGVYATLMGATGCGKSTVLESICGLRRLHAGRILIGTRDVTHLPPGARGLGYVPQDGALFPTLDVRAHLAFAPSVHHWPHLEIDKRVAELANALGIAGLLDRKVQGLSGGERQRVSIGRAIAARPAALLLDEPLSALDESTREEMLSLLKSVQRLENITVLHVTHSPHESKALADLQFKMENGAIRGV